MFHLSRPKEICLQYYLLSGWFQNCIVEQHWTSPQWRSQSADNTGHFQSPRPQLLNTHRILSINSSSNMAPELRNTPVIWPGLLCSFISITIPFNNAVFDSKLLFFPPVKYYRPPILMGLLPSIKYYCSTMEPKHRKKKLI